MWARHHLRPLPHLPELDAPPWLLPTRSPRPPSRLRALVWLRRPRLDAALAAGANPAGSALLEWRPAALVSREGRNRLARAAVRSGL